jgi:hypothetical protein
MAGRRGARHDRVSRWLDEKIDLARVYAEIWKDAAPAHVVKRSRAM